jgi:murein DD-endopeptidase MepM/ murein hydrolase activator NlpD
MARLVNPWPAGRTINARSRYGPRKHPISGRPNTFHHGVDVAGQFPVTAAADGKVSKVSWSPTGGGHVCIIDHGDLVTVYYHGAHKTALKVGQRVSAGDFIYTSGTTGASTGNHLHFEVRRPGGKWGDTMDPERFLPKPGAVAAPEPALPAPEPTAEPAPKPPAPFVPTGHPRPTADLMAWLLKRRGK